MSEARKLSSRQAWKKRWRRAPTVHSLVCCYFRLAAGVGSTRFLIACVFSLGTRDASSPRIFAGDMLLVKLLIERSLPSLRSLHTPVAACSLRLPCHGGIRTQGCLITGRWFGRWILRTPCTIVGLCFP